MGSGSEQEDILDTAYQAQHCGRTAQSDLLERAEATTKNQRLLGTETRFKRCLDEDTKNNIVLANLLEPLHHASCRGGEIAPKRIPVHEG